MKIAEQIDVAEERIGGQFDLIICTMTLVAFGELTLDDTMQAAQRYWTETVEENCENCAYHNQCILCIREEM